MGRVLVVGGTGLLGQHFRGEARRRGHSVVATCRGTEPVATGDSWRPLDLSRTDAIAPLVREVQPDVLLNGAALTDVDGCEDRAEEAEAVNGIAPGLLAEIAESLDIPFVHVSTDYVFDGRGPADESTEPHPLGVYGRTKLEGERRALKAYSRSIVLRLSAVFGWNRLSPKTNSVTWILNRLEAGQEAPLFRDQRVTATFAATAAQAALDLVGQGASGLFHVACRGCLSRVEMGHAIAEAFGLSKALIRPTTTASMRLKAPRPLSPCLVVQKVEETLKWPMPSFRDCLDEMRRTR